MKRLLPFLFLITFVCKDCLATDLTFAKTGPSLGIVVGGDFATTGTIYSDRDPRFQFGLNLNFTNFAFPVTISFGQDVLILGTKPSLKLPLAITSLEGLSIAPGLGFVFNWWHYTGSYDIDADVIEIGPEFYTQIRYDLHDQPFYFAFTPLCLDFNVWRYLWGSDSYGNGSTSTSNTDFGIIYNLLAEFGVKF